jgi:hypothetical protein
MDRWDLNSSCGAFKEDSQTRLFCLSLYFFFLLFTSRKVGAVNKGVSDTAKFTDGIVRGSAKAAGTTLYSTSSSGRTGLNSTELN